MRIFLTLMCTLLLWLPGCTPSSPEAPFAAEVTATEGEGASSKENDEEENQNQNEDTSMTKIKVSVGGYAFSATLEENQTAQAFLNLLPMTLSMSELNGNEKYHYLLSALPGNASTAGEVHAGDIMLYDGSCVVLFYKTFKTGYSYVKIGSVDDPSLLEEALGSGQADVTFEKSE